MDQPARRVAYGSLNSECRCLKLVDTFRSGIARSNYYRPLQILSYAVAYQAGGLKPWAYHLVNISLHAVASMLVYLICMQLLLGSFASIFAAALFAVHPVHTEAVTWMAGLTDVGCGVFYFASVWVFLIFLRDRTQRFLWLSAILFGLALLFKEMAITLPVVIFALAVLRDSFSRARLKQVALNLLPYLSVALAYLLVRWNALGFLVTSHRYIDADLLDWATLVPRVFGQYIRYMVVPYPLAGYHLIPTAFYDRIPSTLMYSAVILVAGTAVWATRRKIFSFPLWAGLFSLMLVPVFNFVGIGENFFAERYLYIPSFALIVPLAMVTGRWPGRAKYVFSGCLIVLFGGLTLVRNGDWENNERFYSSTLDIYPEATMFRVGLGNERMKAGDDPSAETHYRRAIQDAQSNRYAQHQYQDYGAYIGLAGIAARQRRYAEAKEYLEEAAKVRTDDVGLYVYLGSIAMVADGDYEVALSYLRKAVQMEPLSEVAHDYLGVVLFNVGQYDEALRHFEISIRINPNYQDGQIHLEMTKEKLSERADP